MPRTDLLPGTLHAVSEAGQRFVRIEPGGDIDIRGQRNVQFTPGDTMFLAGTFKADELRALAAWMEASEKEGGPA